MAAKIKVIIFLEGGLIQGVFSEKDIDVIVHDCDTDGLNQDIVSKDHNNEDCYYSEPEATTNKSFVRKCFRTYKTAQRTQELRQALTENT